MNIVTSTIITFTITMIAYLLLLKILKKRKLIFKKKNKK